MSPRRSIARSSALTGLGERLRARHRVVSVLAGAAAVTAAALLVAVPAGAAAAPAWTLGAASYPTNFAPGAAPGGGAPGGVPQYYVSATNVGTAPTSAADPITITDTLPDGLTPVGPKVGDNNAQVKTLVPCDVTGQTVTCVDSVALNPGRLVEVRIPVEVDSLAQPSLTSQVSISGGGAPPATTTTTTTVAASPAPFGFLPGVAGLGTTITGLDGGPETKAGSHPYQITLEAGFPSLETGEGEGFVNGGLAGVGPLRDLTVNLPRGVVVNPNATPVPCTEVQLERETCPVASQVGLVALTSSLTSVVTDSSDLYDMVAPRGSPATLGFNALGIDLYVHVMGGVRTERDYELSAGASDILARPFNPIYKVQAQLWGDPSSPIHDQVRGTCGERNEEEVTGEGCPVPPTTTPFLTMPSACSPALTTTGSADSWAEPDHEVTASAQTEDAAGNPLGVSGCEELEFAPTLTVRPQVSSAETPTGLHVDLHVPQHEKLGELATANLRDAKVTLPKGLVVNPAGAGGLETCSADQVGLKTAVGESPVHFTAAPANCPNAAKVGTVSVHTPLLDHALPGAVYIATPNANPFGTLLAIYIVVEDPETGIVIKLAGKIEADPATGQLTTTFDEGPQLPFEDFELDFFGGPRAALRTPSTCGSFATQGQLTPWSGTAPVQTSDSFAVSQGANGGPCAAEEAQLPNAPGFEAGTQTPLAGAYSPFVLRLHRADGSQTLRSVSVSPPPGLLGKLAGVEECSDAALAAAAAKSGAQEQLSPSCPQSSEVGTVTVAAGAGSQPYQTSGRAYLAGPYKGAPVSLAIVTPAVAGPYDLGTVVVRSALYINPDNAQITAKSDPIPTILDGIPLDIRSVAIEMSRPQFTLNPTSCEAMAVSGEAVAVSGQVAPLSNRFQVGGCTSLAFKPSLSLKVSGSTKRGGTPALRAELTYPQGSSANISRAAVALSHSEFLDQAHIRTVCTRVQFAAKQCPVGSIYGHARAITPLLAEPLEGPVYLRSSSHELPDLVAALQGPPARPVEVILDGRVDSVHGAIRNTFEAVPDAPVSKFVLTMQGGKKGLLENSTNLCASTHRATAQLKGQNGARRTLRPVLRNDCGRHRKKRRAGNAR